MSTSVDATSNSIWREMTPCASRRHPQLRARRRGDLPAFRRTACVASGDQPVVADEAEMGYAVEGIAHPGRQPLHPHAVPMEPHPAPRSRSMRRPGGSAVSMGRRRTSGRGAGRTSSRDVEGERVQPDHHVGEIAEVRTGAAGSTHRTRARPQTSDCGSTSAAATKRGRIRRVVLAVRIDLQRVRETGRPRRPQAGMTAAPLSCSQPGATVAPLRPHPPGASAPRRMTARGHHRRATTVIGPAGAGFDRPANGMLVVVDGMTAQTLASAPRKSTRPVETKASRTGTRSATLQPPAGARGSGEVHPGLHEAADLVAVMPVKTSAHLQVRAREIHAQSTCTTPQDGIRRKWPLKIARSYGTWTRHPTYRLRWLQPGDERGCARVLCSVLRLTAGCGSISRSRTAGDHRARRLGADETLPRGTRCLLPWRRKNSDASGVGTTSIPSPESTGVGHHSCEQTRASRGVGCARLALTPARVL